MVHLKSQNKLLLFGGIGIDYYNEYEQDTIYSYSISNKKWNTLSTQLPIPLCYFGYVLTKDEKKIIIFGGFSIYWENMNAIYICDIDTMKFKKADILCPTLNSIYGAVIMDCYDNNELLTYGYLRLIWKSKLFLNLRFISMDVILIINSMYCMEYVYLLDTKNNHWKIKLVDIF